MTRCQFRRLRGGLIVSSADRSNSMFLFARVRAIIRPSTPIYPVVSQGMLPTKEARTACAGSRKARRLSLEDTRRPARCPRPTGAAQREHDLGATRHGRILPKSAVVNQPGRWAPGTAPPGPRWGCRLESSDENGDRPRGVGGGACPLSSWP